MYDVLITGFNFKARGLLPSHASILAGWLRNCAVAHSTVLMSKHVLVASNMYDRKFCVTLEYIHFGQVRSKIFLTQYLAFSWKLKYLPCFHVYFGI